MSLTRFRLARASRVERQIIESMRAIARGSAVSDGFDNASREALAAMVRAVMGQGTQFRDQQADYVSGDEARLLGWLAVYQREGVVPPLPAEHPLSAVLIRTAQALKAAHFLPQVSALRVGLRLLAPAGSSAKRRASPGAGSAGRTDTLRERAVAYVRDHGRVTSGELGAIGISRQYLRTLRMNGALRRVSYGVYAVPDASEIHSAAAPDAPRVHRVRGHGIARGPHGVPASVPFPGNGHPTLQAGMACGSSMAAVQP